MNPCILKNMDISTCHITERDSQLLGLVEQENPLVVYPYEYGFLVYAAYDDRVARHQAAQQFGYSPSLVALLEMAEQHGCHFLHLDESGEEYEELASFEW